MVALVRAEPAIGAVPRRPAAGWPDSTQSRPEAEILLYVMRW